MMPTAVPQTPPKQTGVNIFTPAYDPNAAPSPYTAPPPPTMMSMQHAAPTPPRGKETYSLCYLLVICKTMSSVFLSVK